MEYLQKELTPNQMKRVDVIADAILSLGLMESRYLNSSLRNRVMKACSIDPHRINPEWPCFK